MSRPKELYLVWVDGEDEQYYNQYFSLTDAVKSEDEGTEIFKASLTPLGTFRLVTKLVKGSKKKEKKNASSKETTTN